MRPRLVLMLLRLRLRLRLRLGLGLRAILAVAVAEAGVRLWLGLRPRVRLAEPLLDARLCGIKERICADSSDLGVGRSGQPTRAGRRLCALRVLQYDRAELP